jgi:predicted dehydrogenase
MQKLRAGVIGLGVGQSHVETYRKHPHCEIAAVCDLSSEKLQSFRQRVPEVRVTTRADELLCDPDVDIVSIASYDQDHFGQVCQAIVHGKHVFVEKPLALKGDEVQQIFSLLRDHPHVKLSSNLILRCSPRFMNLKEMISSGRIGDLFYLEADYVYGRLHKLTEGWRGQADYYSVVLGGGIHMIDLLLWLNGCRIIEVVALGTRIATRKAHFRFDDTVVCLLKFENGVIGKMTANFGCVHPHFHGLNVYGTQATFKNAVPDAFWIDSSEPDHPVRRISTPYPGVHKGELLKGFVDHILYGTASPLPSQAVFDAMSVCVAIERSLHNHERVQVEYVGDEGAER